jgi:hypothetical protein
MSLTHILLGNAIFYYILYFAYQGVCCVATITRQPVTTNIREILTAYMKRTSAKKTKKDLTSNLWRPPRRPLDNITPCYAMGYDSKM